MLADAIIQYTKLALQLANQTATESASLAQTFFQDQGPHRQKEEPTQIIWNVIARTNQKMDESYRRTAV